MVEVRAANSSDAAAIRAVHLAAFPTSAEADLVECLEGDGDAIVSLVATDRGQIVGHILFSRMRAHRDGKPVDALGLAPVAVLPDRQADGIGTALIEAGLDGAKLAGTELVFVLGEPDYYGRFGFKASTAAPYASPYAGPYFQAKAIAAQFIAPSSGRADYAPAFAALS